MILLFKLSMPNVGSWNNQWTGEGRLYARTRSFRGKKQIEKAKDLIGSYFYDFGDGWTACVYVTEISPSDSRKINKNSVGFCGYEWMIDSIVNNGEIKIPSEPVHKNFL